MYWRQPRKFSKTWSEARTLILSPHGKSQKTWWTLLNNITEITQFKFT